MLVSLSDNDLYLVTHRHPDWLRQVTALIQLGIRWIQIRDKHASDEEIIAQTEAILDFCHSSNIQCQLLINDRVGLASRLGVGVHLGQGDLSPRVARDILGPRAVIGWTIHDDIDTAQTALEYIDYVGVGPIYPTTTKTDTKSVLGVERLRTVVEEVGVPVVAIGGINHLNIADVRDAKPWKIAMSSALMQTTQLAGFVD